MWTTSTAVKQVEYDVKHKPEIVFCLISRKKKTYKVPFNIRKYLDSDASVINIPSVNILP